MDIFFKSPWELEMFTDSQRKPCNSSDANIVPKTNKKELQSFYTNVNHHEKYSNGRPMISHFHTGNVILMMTYVKAGIKYIHMTGSSVTSWPHILQYIIHFSNKP